MKILLPVLWFLLIAIQLFAQGPVFQSSWFPVQGAQFVGQSAYGAGVSAGQAGPDQVWDFSFLVDSSNQKVTTYLDPQNTANPSWYPNANLASEENGTYAFYQSSGSGVSFFGEYNEFFSIILTDPSTNFEFPFSYGDTFSDSLSGTLNFSGIVLDHSGEVTFEADGYGTLILPGDRIFDDVLRYRLTENTVDEHPSEGVIFSSSAVSYVWISPTCPEPLLRISYFYQQNGFDEFESKSVFYSQGVFTSVNEPPSISDPLAVFPNPTDGIITIEQARPVPEVLEISIFDLWGQLVHRSTGLNRSFQLDISHLPNGLYMLNAKLPGQNISKSISVF